MDHPRELLRKIILTLLQSMLRVDNKTKCTITLLQEEYIHSNNEDYKKKKRLGDA